MKEEEVKDKYPGCALHDLYKNKIYLTIGQLKMILNKNDAVFNNVFIILYEKELKKKKGKSLDFYDLANIIDKSFKETSLKSIDQRKFKKVTFKDQKKEEKEQMEEKEEEQKEEKEAQENGSLNDRINKLEYRLKMVETRLGDVEDAIKNGY